jgi:crotonobetainyl-CoA:carnitine CoA-transferase CaiB-like acyl-CoA transferase
LLRDLRYAFAFAEFQGTHAMTMLSPYRVLDLSDERGLLCGQLLADMGADVIKVEPPGGSPAREIGPFLDDTPGPERSLFWWSYNRNKRGITLDLERPAGRELLKRLAARADFLIESSTPGRMEAAGLGYGELEKINPALIYVSITPFGQDGPKALYADADLILMAASGPLVLTGDDDRPPVRLSVPQAYLHASSDAAVAALVAHHERVRSGRGQHIDVAAQASVAMATQSYVLAAPLGSPEARRISGGVKFAGLELPLVWPAKDGYIAFTFLFGTALGVFTRKFMEYVCAQGFCDEATRDKDWIAYTELLFSGKEPVSEFERVKKLVAAFTASLTKSELLQLAVERGFLMTPVTTIEEVVKSSQLQARGYWQPMEHPECGRSIIYPGPFAKFSATPIEYRRRAPLVGEHNREVLAEAGVGAAELERLAREGVV